MAKVIVGLYDDLANARNAVEELVDNGVHRDDISLVSSDPDRQYASQLGTATTTEADPAATGAVGGAIGGSLLGGLAGVLIGLGALAIPGLGPVIAAGPIVAGLAGAGVGAVAGGLVGALTGWGIPEDEAEHYAEGVRRGGTVVMVRATEGQVDRIEQIMNRHSLVNLEERAADWREEGWTGSTSTAATPGRADLSAQAGDDQGGYQSYIDDFHRHHETYYAATGRPYTYFAPAYRFGYMVGIDRRYQGRSWRAIEPEARQRWEREFPGMGSWSEFDGAVQFGWDRATEQNRIPTTLDKRF